MLYFQKAAFNKEVMISQQLKIQGLDEHEEVYLLAKSIRDSQRQEIFMMQDWLAEWY